ncbi:MULTISPECIES: ArdC-like ssDNA-binding domain-containing protein [unclassified Bradyrhizobium]|uniref:ArdC-like ssDNA-binding domain-containing protein n=1 Tax=unclassified Bradyrhizobium TaxID=2631580 RepID=UPI001FF81A2C|nr:MULTISPECIES: ArdC-like ssDNA-binding domain-containing protein [unclassified Bradyrhizobium]MCK1508721.1 DUF1738 domain-containing protein [Bradyrhizobium sp. 18]MCK1538402.1 DUF1738 domain-containing protein [Bradyrhizobium sp. 176]MCK1556078.1 DUF1738 domain-containing protein [Bradyrhizobium sp. 171]
MPVNVLTKNGYSNIVSLWVAAQLKGFSSPVWATYKQWSELGAQVRAGVKSSPVIFYKEFDAEPLPTLRMTTANRVSPAHRAGVQRGAGRGLRHEPSAGASRSGRPHRRRRCVRESDGRAHRARRDRAFYRLSTDSIQMPPEEMFCGTETLSRSEGYYATLVHELTRRETQARSHVRQTLRRSGLRRRGIGR